jgi:hypothetical protein
LSFEITQSFVQQYRDNVVFLAQQKGSRFRDCVRLQPDIVGLNYYFERIGATGVVRKTSRHTPTPLISTPHSRRRVSMDTVQWSDGVDNDDKLKLLINPESEYVINAKMSMGRAMDDYIVDGALNAAFSGTDGQTSVAFPAGQIVADTAIANLTSLDSGSDDAGQLSPQRLLAIKEKFDIADVDPDEERYIAVSPIAIQSMLSHVATISADYNTVKALAQGAVDTYAGFKFIMSNRLPAAAATPFGPFERTTYASAPWTSGNGVSATTDRLAFAWAQSGLGFAMQEDVMVKIAEDPSMSFMTRVYMEMVMGATRIEEVRVVAAPLKVS